jgi:hypothetical protein
VRKRSVEQLIDERTVERRAVPRRQMAKRLADLDRAMTLVYEAGLRACLVLLAAEGCRLRTGEGHHRAALEAALAIGGDPIQPNVSRLDDARRYRNANLYGDARPVGAAEFNRLLADVEAMLRIASARLTQSAAKERTS